MDHARPQALKIGAVFFIALTLCGQTRDPADILVEARDRVLAEAVRHPRVSCILTADRSYFAPVNLQDRKPPCDRIAADRGKAALKLKLEATDRIRLRVLIESEREILSWIDPLTFESHDPEDVLARGPISLGTYLAGIFGDPETRFQYLSEKVGKIEYGFREPAESSHHLVKAGDIWLPTEQTGSFLIDAMSLDPDRLIVQTGTLPPETSMCESQSTVDFHRVRIGADNILLPARVESRDVMTSTREISTVIGYSSCAAANAPEHPASKGASILPPNYRISLAFDGPIDSGIVAGGDVISATVMKDVAIHEGTAQPGGLHRGDKVRGRILHTYFGPTLDRYNRPAIPPENRLMIAISFDEMEVGKTISPLRMRIDREAMGLARVGTIGSAGDQWEAEAMVFHSSDKRIVVPSGFESAWITVK